MSKRYCKCRRSCWGTFHRLQWGKDNFSSAKMGGRGEHNFSKMEEPLQLSLGHQSLKDYRNIRKCRNVLSTVYSIEMMLSLHCSTKQQRRPLSFPPRTYLLKYVLSTSFMPPAWNHLKIQPACRYVTLVSCPNTPQLLFARANLSPTVRNHSSTIWFLYYRIPLL